MLEDISVAETLLSEGDAEEETGLEPAVAEWMATCKLQRFADFFVTAAVQTLADIKALTEEKLEAMGVALPGHKRKILVEVAKLNGEEPARSPRKRHHVATASEVPDIS